MPPEEILPQLVALFREVLKQPTLELHPHTTAHDVQGWDSLNHAILLAEVQRQFGVRFSVREVIKLKTIGQLIELLHQKLK